MRKGWKKYAFILFALMLVLAACGNGGDTTDAPAPNDGDNKEPETAAQPEDSTKYKVGVTQIVEHPSLNAAFDGLKKLWKMQVWTLSMISRMRRTTIVRIRQLPTTWSVPEPI